MLSVRPSRGQRGVRGAAVYGDHGPRAAVAALPLHGGGGLVLPAPRHPRLRECRCAPPHACGAAGCVLRARAPLHGPPRPVSTVREVRSGRTPPHPAAGPLSPPHPAVALLRPRGGAQPVLRGA
eukprot:3992034-Prymnesium_polylepis.1